MLVSTSNIVHDKVITLDEEITQDELNRTARYLNAEFEGKSLIAIRAEIIALMKQEKALYDSVVRNAILLCERSFQDEDAETAEVYLDGASNILGKPEFSELRTSVSCFAPLKRSLAWLRFLMSVWRMIPTRAP